MLMQNKSHTAVYLAYTAGYSIRSCLSLAAGGHTCIVDRKHKITNALSHTTLELCGNVTAVFVYR